MGYLIKFDNLDSWEYKTLWITYESPENGFGFAYTASYHYGNRRQIAELFGLTTTQLTKILVNKYNAIHYGGRKYHSTFLFKNEDIPKVKEYIESLLIAKKLQNNS